MAGVEEVNGDLFSHKGWAIAHGCNTMGAMGAGVAKLARQRHPAMYTQYRKHCNEGLFATGSSFIWQTGLDGDFPYQNVVNLGTQISTGADAKCTHIYEAFWRLSIHYSIIGQLETYHLGIPLIGCGIGGLKWDDVKATIEEALEKSNIQVTAYYL